MTQDETRLAGETATAMRELASTVTDAPPLRLTEPRGARGPRRRPSPRRWARWAVPLAAAVAVITLAVVLVVVKDLPDGRAPRPAYPARPAVPAYYVVPEQTCQIECDPARLVVGDTLTGGTLATIAPPDGGTFMAVSGAADDRTFVADTVLSLVDVTRPEQATWYRITLSPGSSPAATLTRLPIPAGPPGAGVESIALSPSGLELAVTYHLGTARPGTTVLRIYSVATGRLLHSWSTGQQVLFGGDPYNYGAQVNNQLNWVDGDRGLAFTSSPLLANPNTASAAADQYATVRVLNVAAAGSDLIADSRLVWSTTTIGSRSQPGCQAGPAPLLSANGKTVLCADTAIRKAGSAATSAATSTFSWLGYQASAPKTARALYKVSATALAAVNGGPGASVLWASPSAATLVIAWTVDDASSADIHFGVVSDGRFTRLPAPLGQASYRLFDTSSGIAW